MDCLTCTEPEVLVVGWRLEADPRDAFGFAALRSEAPADVYGPPSTVPQQPKHRDAELFALNDA